MICLTFINFFVGIIIRKENEICIKFWKKKLFNDLKTEYWVALFRTIWKKYLCWCWLHHFFMNLNLFLMKRNFCHAWNATQLIKKYKKKEYFDDFFNREIIETMTSNNEIQPIYLIFIWKYLHVIILWFSLMPNHCKFL